MMMFIMSHLLIMSVQSVLTPVWIRFFDLVAILQCAVLVHKDCMFVPFVVQVLIPVKATHAPHSSPLLYSENA